jgi:hypothetical protein
MNRYDFALGKKPEIVFNSKKSSVPKNMDEAVDYIIEEFMTHMAVDYLLENPDMTPMSHVTLFTDLRARHLAGVITEEMFISQFKGLAHRLKNDWNLWEHSDITKDFFRLDIRNDADKTYEILLSLAYRRINKITNGKCYATGNECPSPKLNNGSYGLNSGCGGGLC